MVATSERDGFAAGGSEPAAAAPSSVRALHRGREAGLSVLLYHYVGPAAPGGLRRWTIPGERFERDMAFLARRRYVGIRPADWLAWLREGKGLPEKPVLITFDDAYADLTAHALPALERWGFGAAVFVVTALVGKTNLWDERAGYPSRQLMTGDQIRAWAARGIEFGAHSRTHPELPSLPDAQLQDEIAGSRDELEQVLGRAVETFAYPYGLFDGRVRGAVRGSFALAFTLQPGINRAETDRHLLRRNEVTPGDSLLQVAFRVRYGWSPVERLRAQARFARRRLLRTWSKS